MKEAKKRINNVVTIERNKLFESKFDTWKGDLKTNFKIVNQLLNKENGSKFPNHANVKTLAISFKFFYTNKDKNVKENFKKIVDNSRV